MGQADRLGQHLIELHRARHRARDLRDLERMREARAIQVPFVIDEHLGLVDQAAKRRRMYDAIPIALVLRALLRGRLRMAAAPRLRLMCRVGSKFTHPKYSFSSSASVSSG